MNFTLAALKPIAIEQAGQHSEPAIEFSIQSGSNSQGTASLDLESTKEKRRKMVVASTPTKKAKKKAESKTNNVDQKYRSLCVPNQENVRLLKEKDHNHPTSRKRKVLQSSQSSDESDDGDMEHHKGKENHTFSGFKKRRNEKDLLSDESDKESETPTYPNSDDADLNEDELEEECTALLFENFIPYEMISDAGEKLGVVEIIKTNPGELVHGKELLLDEKKVLVKKVYNTERPNEEFVEGAFL